MMPHRVFVTGLGFVCSIGNDGETVADNLRNLRHGIEEFAPFQETPGCRVFLAGTIKGMDTRAEDPQEWVFPERYRLPRAQLNGMSPHVFYAYRAVFDALEDAGLSRDEISGPGTGLYSASSGSASTLYRQVRRMYERGVGRCSPHGIVRSVAGAVNFNLSPIFKIRGSSCGFNSACSSSAHALGAAFEELAAGRQERIVVVGAEDGDLESILPFAGMRALATTRDPDRASLPFDRARGGFVGSGGAGALILEREDVVAARSAIPCAELAGWGQTTDGFSAASPHPEGEGLGRAMRLALARAGIGPDEIDHINAHATGTINGDAAEALAIKEVFGTRPYLAIGSTKALTGHTLSAAGALEAAFTCLAMRSGMTVGTANLREPDPVCEGLFLPAETLTVAPEYAISNSAGFGGANVSLIFRRCRA